MFSVTGAARVVVVNARVTAARRAWASMLKVRQQVLGIEVRRMGGPGTRMLLSIFEGRAREHGQDCII